MERAFILLVTVEKVWMMGAFYILLLLALTSLLQLTDGRILWRSLNPRTTQKWRRAWNIDQSTYRGKESVKVVRSPDGKRGSANAIFLAQRSYGLTGLNSGTEFYSAPPFGRRTPRGPPIPRDCLTLSYRVWFEDGFNFAYGGKLPGLYGGGVNCTAGTDPKKDCFTTRFIWRTGGAAALALFTKQEQKPEFCDSKDVECNPEWGHRLASGSFQFTTGRWYWLQQTVRLNTPGQADGYIRLSVRGIGQVYETRNIMLRDSDIHVDGIFFSNFFGGTSSCSASPVDTRVYFRNFQLRDNFCLITNRG